MKKRNNHTTLYRTVHYNGKYYDQDNFFKDGVRVYIVTYLRTPQYGIYMGMRKV